LAAEDIGLHWRQFGLNCSGLLVTALSEGDAQERGRFRAGGLARSGSAI
jgi:hypothetical protein